MVAKPKKKKIRIIILIILSLTEAANAALYGSLPVFESADENHANWPTTLTNLATAIEDAEATLKANDLTAGELTSLAAGIQTALDAYLNNES